MDKVIKGMIDEVVYSSSGMDGVDESIDGLVANFLDSGKCCIEDVSGLCFYRARKLQSHEIENFCGCSDKVFIDRNIKPRSTYVNEVSRASPVGNPVLYCASQPEVCTKEISMSVGDHFLLGEYCSLGNGKVLNLVGGVSNWYSFFYPEAVDFITHCFSSETKGDNGYRYSYNISSRVSQKLMDRGFSGVKYQTRHAVSEAMGVPFNVALYDKSSVSINSAKMCVMSEDGGYVVKECFF